MMGESEKGLWNYKLIGFLAERKIGKKCTRNISIMGCFPERKGICFTTVLDKLEVHPLQNNVVKECSNGDRCKSKKRN